MLLVSYMYFYCLQAFLSHVSMTLERKRSYRLLHVYVLNNINRDKEGSSTALAGLRSRVILQLQYMLYWLGWFRRTT
jgi:hypothetical protein